MRYFPDSCFKRVPDKDYFWKVFSILYSERYSKILEEKIKTLRENSKIKEDKIVLTREAQEIFDSFECDGNLSLLSNLKSQARCGLKNGSQCY